MSRLSRKSQRSQAAMIAGLAALLSNASAAAKTSPITSIAIKDGFDEQSPIQAAAARAITEASEGDITLEQIRAGRSLLFSWFGRHTTDAIFFVTTHPLDYNQVCFAMELEDETFRYAGCAMTSDPVVYCVNRGRLRIPWLRVKLEQEWVTYCWNGDSYSEQSETKTCY